ncbi:MAG: class I tRNA ligase family protein, partial [Candidatus Sumerlaeia bacterium]|nr:class I tRNA ligase family protein [Candidatus Sumerlaeia bacterium]
MGEKFYITTPLYYVNDIPHLGHLFEVIGIDVLARFRRLQG